MELKFWFFIRTLRALGFAVILIGSAVFETAAAQGNDSAMAQSGGQTQIAQALNFSTQSAALSTTVASKMKMAEVPLEFECPLFSNSPYSDILTAIDGLQSAINLFPTCQADSQVQKMAQTGEDLREKILLAKKTDENGGSANANLIENILARSAEFQAQLAHSSSAAPCYKEEGSKKLIFQVNDALQSLSPLALEFVTKNPALSSSFLPMLAGAKALSQGISTLEKVVSETATLDMKDPQNRLAVIKNTCQFMKVYNKVEYLQMGRAERLKKINEDFNLKLQPIVKRQSSLLAVLNSNQVFQSETDKLIFKTKASNQKNERLLKNAVDEMSLTKSKVGQCSVVKTLISLKVGDSILTDLDTVYGHVNGDDQVAFKRNKLIDIQADTLKAHGESAEVCVARGEDWIASLIEVSVQIEKSISEYEKQNLRAMNLLQTQKSFGETKTKTQNLQENKRKLEKFTELSAFEPSELAKRIRGMPKYLFNGTNGNMFQKAFKNGPVYDFLMDNNNSFEMAIGEFKRAIKVLTSYEYEMIRKEGPKYLESQKDVARMADKFAEYSLSFPHIVRNRLAPGSVLNRKICNAMQISILKYLEATDHIGANQYLCQMIAPVLKEAEVSLVLRRYCQSSANFVGGESPAGYSQAIQSLFTQGYKTQIETILDKYDDLDCD